MLRKLKNIFGSTNTLSTTSSQELKDTVRGIVLDRFRDIRVREGRGVLAASNDSKLGSQFQSSDTADDTSDPKRVEGYAASHSSTTSPDTGLLTLLSLAESEIESELSSSSLYAHRVALQQVLNRQHTSLTTWMVESSGSGYGKVIPKRFLDRAGFQLRTAESTVPGAGMGLFLEGDVMAGSLVGYFPGKVWLSEHLKRPEDMEKVKKDEKYETMMR